MSWIMILVVYSISGSAGITHEFATKEGCHLAMHMTEETFGKNNVKGFCVEKQ